MARNKHAMYNGRGKRTAEQREYDLKRISQLLFTGNYTRHQITEIINGDRDESQHISVSQVGLDIRKLRKDWAEKRTDTIEYLVNRELQRLDVLEATLWEALRKETRTIATSKTSTMGDSYSETIEELVPNPAMYDKILSVHKERRKLLGLYAPSVNLTANIEVKGYSVVSPDDWPEQDSSVVEGEYKQLKDEN